MKNIIFSVLTIILIFFVGLVFFLTFPNDPQFKSYYWENKAIEAYINKDIDTYFKYMDNPVTVKYHAPSAFKLAITYAKAAKFDDALRVVNSYERYEDYSYCMAYKTAMRFLCRVENSFKPAELKLDRNIVLSHLYLEKGDYQKAMDFDRNRTKPNPCFSARLYADAAVLNDAEFYLKQCTNKYETDIAKGIIAQKQNKYIEAEKYFKAAVNKNCATRKSCSGNNTVYFYLSELYKYTGEKAKSIEYAKKILESEPHYYKAQLNLK